MTASRMFAYVIAAGVGALTVAIASLPPLGLMVALGLGVNVTVLTLVACALLRARTRERAAEFAEKASQRRFERLFHASPVALSLSSMTDRRLVEINDAYTRTFGVRRPEIIGRTPEEVGVVIERRDELLSALETRGSIEARLKAQTIHGERDLMVWSSVVELEGKPYAFTTFLDITQQLRDQEAARTSDESMRELAENVREIFWISDPNSRTTLYVSPAYEKIFGRRCADIYANARDWVKAIHPDDRARLRASSVPKDLPWEDEFRIVRPDGEVRSLHVSVTPIRDTSGTVVRLAGTAEDVTDRIVLESQVRQTQKLESLGLLAGGVAHDFNNILAVVAANASLLAESIPHEGENAELVHEIEAAVVRATSLTRQLLAFSRKQVIEPVVVDLNAAVGDTRKMLRRMLGEDISIVTSLEPDLGHVLIDPGYLVQVMMNLAVNARDAMPRGGRLTIESRNIKRGDAREVMLAMGDSGCGMAPDVVARIFEPFYTTKGVGRGTGLGLSVVHGIVEQAGGRIEVESAIDIGTTMKIFLPAVDAPAEKITDVAVVGATGTEQIVLVDDDMFVRTAASRSLRARGYQVHEASDAQGALRLLGDHKDVALLVTDVVMPGLDGHQLVEAARARRPSLKVLYISGYTDDAVLHHGVESAKVAILEKPFRGHALVGKVRQILDAA